MNIFLTHQKRCRFLLLIISIVFGVNPTLGFGNEPPALPLSLVPDYSSNFSINYKKKAVFCQSGYIPGPVPTYANNLKQEIQIDDPGGLVVVREKVLDNEISLPTVLTFEQYQNIQHREQLGHSWQQRVVEQFQNTNEGSGGIGAINLDIPVKIKSRAFQKIFGGSSVGLAVAGDIKINMSLRREDRSEVRTAVTRGANTNFKMEQTQRFTVTGKIGDKVTVNVDQDSERAFEFDNNVRLNYQGYDDEIVKRVEAGNISLSLPGTRYVTFSGKSSGLFGIKSDMALGNLNITAIASQEKGESQKLSLTGGATENLQQIRDYRYLDQTYYFLDESYREQYRYYTANGDHQLRADIATPIIPDSIEVYKSAAGYETKFPDTSIRGWAMYDFPTNRAVSPADTGVVKSGEVESGFFVRMEKDEYYVENSLGFIRFNTRLSNDEIIAVAYKTTRGTTYGDLNFVRTDSTSQDRAILLKLIKSRNPIPSHKVWNLSWKNVYSLGGRNVEEEGLEIKMFYEPPSGSPQETDDKGVKWLHAFGLDETDPNGQKLENGDGFIDMNSNILNLGRGELQFPDLQPFDPIGYFVDGQLVKRVPEDKTTRAIYDTTVQSVISAQSKFYVEVKSKNRSANYDLGFNVIEGSEIVTLDGRTLQKDVDYNIDYFSGTLTILDEGATNPSANLDVTYERNQLFQLEKKTILGTRAEYDLGGDSFIGGTFLYLNETTLDQKVRVGRGPMQNMVWDINTRLKFNPNFIGNAFDWLPFIRASGETSLNFEGELAQVSPTPNTLNNSRTGDNKGVAYIDDFEASKKTSSLGVLRRNWTQASVPKASKNDQLHQIGNMVNYFWYNPFGQVAIKEIYPERDVNPNVPQRTHVLTLDIYPDRNNPDPNNASWGGVMRALSPGFFDQTQTKFIEIMVQGEVGKMHVDLGVISEDVIPNGKLDTEDRKVNGIRDGLLDQDEDLGIDGVAGPDPPDLNHPRSDVSAGFDFWDINGNGIKDANEPWSYDNWIYSESNPNLYVQQGGSISGTEANINDEGGRLPDTEDINGNGTIDLNNAYFTYSFDLDSTSVDRKFIAGGNPAAGWKLYRIPFITDKDSVQVGNPAPTQIEYVRIWVDDVDRLRPGQSPGNPVRIRIADISLVGNDWKELGITRDPYDLTTGLTQETETIGVSVKNTHENPDYGQTLSQIGVEGEEDRVTGVQAREQSLVILADQLPAQFAGVTEKSLFQGENYIHYDRIKMFVYGLDHGGGQHISKDTSYVEYFFRFGADKRNYYEYRGRVYSEWDKRNHMDVALQDFTTLKFDTTVVEERRGILVKSLGEGKFIAVKGNPSLTNIKTLTIGIRNLHPNNAFFSGEVWFNELRLSDIQQDKGMAMRVRADMKIADFASINGEVERKDADFHNVATRFGTGDNQLSGSFNANIGLDKFLPSSWGISMPFSFNFRNSNSTPKYFPGQDRIVTGEVGPTELELVRSRNSQSGFNFSFRRQARSQNFFMKNTLDKMSFSLGRSRNRSENPNLKFADRNAWSGNFDYGIDFGRNNFFKPFGWLPGLPLIKNAKETKFYFTPQNISFRVNGTKTDQMSQNRIQNSNIGADTTKTETFNMDRQVRASMKIFENLSVDFSRLHRSDMRNSDLVDFFTFNLEDISITQGFSARYSPNIIKWVGNTFNYSSNYRFNNNIQQRTTGRSAGVNADKSAQFTLRLRQFAEDVFGVGKPGRPKRGRRPPGRAKPGEQSPGKDQPGESKEEGEGGGFSFNPFKLFGTFISQFKDIQFNYSDRKNINQFGLVPGNPSLAFQFGLSDTTNVATDSTLSTNNITLNNSNTYSLNSGIGIGRAIDLNLRFQHSEQENQTTLFSGNSSDSWVSLGGFDMPFPEWNLNVNGLNKIPLIDKLFSNFSFSHNYSGQRNINWSGSPDNVTQESITTNFRPLGKIDFRLKNDISGSVAYNRAQTLTQNFVGGVGATKSTNSDFTVTANYSKRSGFKIPIWPFNKAELKNSIDFTFSFSARSSVTARKIGQDENADFDEQDRTSSWSFSPSMTYSFSNQVRGGAFLEIGKNSSKRLGSTSIQEFGFNINIAIRGT